MTTIDPKNSQAGTSGTLSGSEGHEHFEPGEPAPLPEGVVSTNWFEQMAKCDPNLYDLRPIDSYHDDDDGNSWGGGKS